MTYPEPYHLAVMPKGFVPTPEMIADAAAFLMHVNPVTLESIAVACDMAGLNTTEGAACIQSTPEAYLATLGLACRGPAIVARQRTASAILDAVLARHCPVCTDPEGEPPPVIVTL